MIGDILNDVEAGNRAGCYTIHLDNGGETEWVKGDYRQPLYAVKDLAAAADIICRYAGSQAHRCRRLPPAESLLLPDVGLGSFFMTGGPDRE